MRTPGQTFFNRDPDSVAQDLIGSVLLVDGVAGIIVETEAYDPTDPASKSHLMKRTKANSTMFGPPGRAFIYFNYGLHWLLNIVCQPGCGVLIRALEPTEGLAAMKRRRGANDIRLLCSGPARVSQVLAVTGKLNGLPIFKPPFSIKVSPKQAEIVKGVRIGITKGADLVRRFGLRGSPYLSKKFDI